MRMVTKSRGLEAAAKFILESPWFAIVVISACFAACVVIWVHPLPGSAVTVLAAAAFLMTLRGDVGYRERAAWVAVVFALLLVALRSIRLDREHRDAQQRQELADLRSHFNDIAQGIKSAIAASDRHFSATMEKSDALVATSSRAAELAEQGINATIGRGSYCWLLVADPDSAEPELVASQHGRYPVRDVTARLVDLQKFSRLTAGQPVTMDGLFAAGVNYTIGDLAPHTGRILGHFEINGEPGGRRGFNIFFSGLNGNWSERLRLRRVAGRWRQAIEVMTEQVRGTHTDERVLFKQVDPAYPRKNGKVVWAQ